MDLTTWLWLLGAAIFGVVLIGVGATWYHFKAIGHKWGAGATVVIGVAFILLALVLGVGTLPTLNSNGNGNASTPTGGTYNVVFATAPAVPTGCTEFVSTNTEFCTVVFNSTTNYLAIQSSVASTFHNPNYLVTPWNLVRTDNANRTFSANVTLTTVPTFNSLASSGGSTTVCSPLGYTTATSSKTGQWQAFFDQGTFASQKPTGNAPNAGSSALSTGVPVTAFGSKVVGLHESLAGGNSTSFGTTCAQAWTNNTSVSVVVTVAQGYAPASQVSWTIQFDLLGWHV